jgi:uncharacterized protein (DUF849 family)
VLLKACLNGGRSRDEHPAVPITPGEIASDGARAINAGAGALHVHPRGADETETLEPNTVDAVVRALRTSCPGMPVGLTTGLWAAGGVEERHVAVAAWSELPDFVSVNLSEPGVAELCDLLLDRGIGVEAGVWSAADAERLAALETWPRFLRVLVEAELADAGAITARLAELEIGLPQLHHASDMKTWAVLEAAIPAGHDIRIGLEDTLVLPDGTTARDNADLVSATAALAAAA